MPSRRWIELVYFSGCPHVDLARANVEAALSRLGRSRLWAEWDLGDPGTPTRVRGHASPTVLVGGRDVAGDAPASDALSCRAQGAPSVEQIARAIEFSGEPR